jgi:hypothetical protein
LFSFLLLLLSKRFISLTSGLSIYFSLLLFDISFPISNFLATSLFFSLSFLSSFSLFFFIIYFISGLILLYWIGSFPETTVTKYQTTLRSSLALEDGTDSLSLKSVTYYQTTLSSSLTLEDGEGGCSETSVTEYRTTPPNIIEQQRPPVNSSRCFKES